MTKELTFGSVVKSLKYFDVTIDGLWFEVWKGDKFVVLETCGDEAHVSNKHGDDFWCLRSDLRWYNEEMEKMTQAVNSNPAFSLENSAKMVETALAKGKTSD